MIIWGLTILLGAFLLFQVQPIMGRFILPSFGGGTGVWTVCLLFFQSLLLAGYLYAHLLRRQLRPTAQALLHFLLLGLSLFALPLAPDAAAWIAEGEADPTWPLLALLARSVGIPYLLLAATSPLVQHWFSVQANGRSPYRLYALSNVGSLLALLSYPVWVEPRLTLAQQDTVWSATYALFAVACTCCALLFAKRAPSRPTIDAEGSLRAAPRQIGMWVLYAACGSALLMSTTNQMCQEVASVPFLWVLPLSLYLLSFIICFDHSRWYSRLVFGPLLVVAVTLAVFLQLAGPQVAIWRQVIGYAAALFVACMVCHGELVRSKPAAAELTAFYLAIAAGGALGGVAVALIAPALLPGYYEFPFALLGCCLLAYLPNRRQFAPKVTAEQRHRLRIRLFCWFGAVCALFLIKAGVDLRRVVAVDRNFYGVVRVLEIHPATGSQRILQHGRIIHGAQFLDEARRNTPTAYYGTRGGLGLAMHQLQEQRPDQPMRVAILGMGIGTAAVYARDIDEYVYFEINPAVVRFAEQHFTFLADSRGARELRLGDARLQLEAEWREEGGQRYDVIVGDAFNSDAVPIHLMTLECFQLYREMLKPDGVLVVNISNAMLDLFPVVRGIAAELGWATIRIPSPPDPERGDLLATWVALTDNESFLNDPLIRRAEWPITERDRPPLVWTDDFAALWQVVHW